MNPTGSGVTRQPIVALSPQDFPDVAYGIDVAPTRQALRDFGIDVGAVGEIDRALRVALSHSSVVYENHDLADGLTAGVLEALYGVGLHYLHRTVASTGFNSGGGDFVSISHLVSQAARTIEQWTVEQRWIEQSAALGKGQQKLGINATIRKQLLLQIVGMFCLLNRRSDAARVLQPVVTRLASEPQLPGDPRGELRTRLGSSRIESSVSRSGPDHDPRFRAELVDERGRRAVGAGGSKKEALAEASLEFLSTYLGLERRGLPAPPPKPGLIDIETTQPHARLVRFLAVEFGVPEESLGMLGQSLIHSSWANENKDTTERYRQQPNNSLGTVGAHVVNFEACVTAAANALTSRVDKFSLRTNSNSDWEQVFLLLGLGEGMLVGRGLANTSISQELAGNTLQAVLAAVWVSKQSDELLIDTWPPAWLSALPILAPEAPTPTDPSTDVEKRLGVAGITRDFTFEGSGPGHQRRYRATLCLSSPALGGDISIVGASASGKVGAKHSVSKVVQRALEDCSDVDYLVDALRAPTPNIELVTYLLAAQLAGAREAQSGSKKWREAGLLGSVWLREPSRLVDWAASADALLESRRKHGYTEDEEGNQKLARIYVGMIQSADDAMHKIRGRLRELLQAIEVIDNPEAVSPSEIDDLIQACAYFRALSLEPETQPLSEVVDGCAFVYRDRIAVIQTPSPLVVLAAPEVAMIESIVAAVLRTSNTIEISFTTDSGVAIRGTALASDAEQWADVAEMWSGITPRASCSYRAGCIEIVIAETVPSSNPGPFEIAVVEALSNPSSDVNRQQAAGLADLLHDLKNQLSAAQQALAESTVGRAAQLRQQLASVDHLDRAKLIGGRIGMIAALMSADDAASSDLGVVLRDYHQAALSRWSAKHVLRIPPIREPVLVAIDPITLSALLDNLITNSLEAMPDGGMISIDLQQDSQVVVVQFSDDGPGLPTSVSERWQAGDPIRSTKPGGNGLGILGVKSLLDRLGGGMELASSGTGTRWLLTLPVPTGIASLTQREGDDRVE